MPSKQALSIHRAFYVLTLCLFVLSADNLNICNQSVGQNARPDLGPNCSPQILCSRKNFRKKTQQIYDKKHAFEAIWGEGGGIREFIHIRQA